jgi:hypothetical protein
MDNAQELLFGRFPRAMGVTTPSYNGMELKQYLVHSEAEFDGVVSKTEGRRNLYSSLSAYQPVKTDGQFDGCAVVADKVSFDFDSSAKLSPEEKEQYDEDEETPNWSHPVIPEFASDKQAIQLMRAKDEVREAILGDVCHDVRQLARECIEEGIPIIGVFSGFGIHVHQLRKPTKSRPGDKMLSTCNRWTAELNLSCADEKASGRPFRIMRVPNAERVCHENGDGTGLYQIPLKAAELAEIDPEKLMSLSRSPRPSIGSEPDSRPAMKVQEEYLGPDYEEGVGQEKMRPLPQQSQADDFYKDLIKDLVQMPCVYERAIGRNPPNDVRVKLGIMLLNADYSVDETTDLISKLGWVDFDREVTRYQLKKLKKSGKGDWSCKTMQSKGLCTRADNKTDCPKYGYQGGNSPT